MNVSLRDVGSLRSNHPRLLFLVISFSQFLDYSRIVLLPHLTFAQVTGVDHLAAFARTGRISTLCLAQDIISGVLNRSGGGEGEPI